MKNYSLLLLCLIALMSCKKNVIEIQPQEKSPVIVKKDTTPTIPTDPTLTVASPSGNADRVVEGIKNSSLQNVPVADIDLTMKGSDGTLRALPVHIFVSNTGTGYENANSTVTTLRLYNGAGQQIDSETVPAGNYPAVTFQGLSFSMIAGSTNRLTIKADIAAIDGTVVTSGVKVQVDITPADISATQALDGNGKSIAVPNLLGSAFGSKVYFYLSGIAVTENGTGTNTYSPPGGSQTHGVFTMTVPFSVTAYVKNAYLPASISIVTQGTVSNPTISAGPYVQYVVDNGASLLSDAKANVVYTGSNNLTVDQHGNYLIPVGQTLNFNLVVTYIPTTAGSYRARLVNVNSNTTDSGTEYTTFTYGLNSPKFSSYYVAGQ